MPDIQLDENWKAALLPEFRSDYMAALKSFLVAEKAAGKIIYPKSSEWFRALDLTPLDKVRVVILGQDPYHGPGQAHGLCFSVKPGVRPPPSLLNIFKELESDLGLPRPNHGFLESWAKQGVLMLNNILTVEQGKPDSHKGLGWERFTDAVIAQVNAKSAPIVFMLWGKSAQQKAVNVSDIASGGRHLVLKTTHPSSMGGSAHKGFFGSRHFSKANAFLVAQAQQPIDWRLPDIG